MAKIFISYARRDATTQAQALSEALQAAHHDVFLDTAELKPGDSWTVALERAIDDCDILIVQAPATSAARS